MVGFGAGSSAADSAGTDVVGGVGISLLLGGGAALSSIVNSEGTSEDDGGRAIVIVNRSDMASLVVELAGAVVGEEEETGVEDTAAAEEAGVDDAAAEEEGAEVLEHSVETSPPSINRRRRLFGDTNACLHAKITIFCCAVSASTHSALHDALGWNSVDSGHLSMGRL